MTIVEMLTKNVRISPQKTAIIYKDCRISYKEFYERSNALARFLLSIGLKKGEQVGLLLQKTPYAIISSLGVAIAGGIVFPIDYNQTLAGIQFILNLSHPSALIVDENFQLLLSGLRVPCSDGKIIVIGKRSNNRYRLWEEIFVQTTYTPPDIKVEDNDIFYLNFTSGTTGVPKAAITTHTNIYWSTLSAIESLKLTRDDVHLCMFPVFVHPHELFARALYLGGTIVLIDSISPKTIARAVSEHNVTCMMAVASVYETLVRFHESHSSSFCSLRIPESGGMHTSPTLVQRFKERFNISIIPVWGSTEATGVALAIPIGGTYKPGSMGKPCSHYQIKIVGENGKELAFNEIGEMVVKGPAVCSGYFGNSQDTEKQMKDGWFFTGDLVKKDSEDYFYFAGRKTGMMKVAGLKVFPTEIEDVLSSHPEIAEAAVVKVEHKLHGEVPKAVIALVEGAEINKSDIRKYCEKRMSRYKTPRFIEFVTELPKTPGGKISYQKL